MLFCVADRFSESPTAIARISPTRVFEPAEVEVKVEVCQLAPAVEKEHETPAVAVDVALATCLVRDALVALCMTYKCDTRVWPPVVERME